MALPGVLRDEPRSGYDVIIIGAGIQGLAIAFELTKRGHNDVLVVDKSWPGSGASGRNGELIRSAFSTTQWCDFFELSRQKWGTLSAELDHNVLYNRTGYAVLASTEAQWQQCRADADFQRQRGIETDLLDERAARHYLPAVNPDLVRGAVVQHQAGFAHHDAVVAGYLASAARQGVHVVTDTAVAAISRSGEAIAGIVTSSGKQISARVVINAAGGHAQHVNRMVGLTIPLVSARLEMIVTQPVKPFLVPGLAALELLGYCHQTGRGEFVGGTELPRVDETTSLNGSWEMLRDMATKFVKLFPALAGVRLLRHWSGTVSQTPDLAPVIGPVPEVPGYVLTVGWVYGFMGAPAAGELIAEYVTTGLVDSRMAALGIERTRTGEWISEGSLVVDMGH